MRRTGVAAILIAGCSIPQGAVKDEPTGPLDWSGNNCLIVVLDALTVNHLALWGYDRQTTPNIDRLAQRGIVFRHARSQASSTPPSVHSFFTGRYPPLLRSEQRMRITELAPGAHTFAEAFNDAGYDTGAFSGNLYVSPKAGFDQGFDRFDLILRHLPAGYGGVQLDEQSTEKLLAAAQDWIHTRDANPWLCYVHILRPHNPYRAPDPWGSTFAGDYNGPVDGSDAYWQSVDWKPPPEDVERLKDYYDGNLRYVDALLGEFLDALDASRRLDDTAIVITADHGEAFMEHGFMLHNATVHDELIRVPLIVVPPKHVEVSPSTVGDPVQLVDLYPTLAALFELDAPTNPDGVPLLAAMSGAPMAPRPMFAQDGDGDMMCIIDDARKLVVAYDLRDRTFQPIELFDLVHDPVEQHNLLQTSPPSATETMLPRAGAYIDAHIQNESSRGDHLVAYEKEVLETLGYL